LHLYFTVLFQPDTSPPTHPAHTPRASGSLHACLIAGNLPGPELNRTAILHRAFTLRLASLLPSPCLTPFTFLSFCFRAVGSGLIKAHIPGSSRTSGFNFSALRKGLKLVVNEPDQMTDAPSDVSYLYKVTCCALH